MRLMYECADVIFMNLDQQSLQASPQTSFSEIHSHAESELHPVVSTVLWKMTAKSIGIPLEAKMSRHDLFNKTNLDPSSLRGYQELARHCNQLIDIHETLLNQLPSPSVEVLSRELCSTDPTVRLTSTATNILADEVSRLYIVLRQGRFQARIQREKEATE